MAPNKLVVIVDDDANITDTVSEVITEQGYRTITFNTGCNFMHHLLDLNPDLFLLDVRLPDISGDRIARLIRRQPKYRHTPIILVSANTNLSSICCNSLADAYIEKPFDFDNLLKLISYHLDRSV